MAIGMGCVAIQWSAINSILPLIQSKLSASLSQLQWMMNVYGIFVASTLIFWGHCADRYGRKKIYLIGIGLYVIGNIINATASDIWFLVLGQGFVGLSAGVLLPVSQAILSNAFDPNEVHKAIGYWATTVGFCLALGPSIGGFLGHFWGWPGLFVLASIVGVVAMIMSVSFVKESRVSDDLPSNDVKGTILLCLTIAMVVLVIDQAHAWGHALIISLSVLAIILLMWLIAVERKVKSPIISPVLLRHRRFRLASWVNFCLFLCLWPVFFFIPLILGTVFSYSTIQIGLFMLSVSLPVALFSGLCSKLYNQWGAGKTIMLGFGFLFIFLVTWLAWSAQRPVWELLSSAFCFGLAWVLIWTPSNITGISSLPQQQAGMAAGTFITIQELGGTLGLAVMVSVARLSPHLLIGVRSAVGIMIGICVVGFIFAYKLK